jgi:hypothetical protein
MKTWQQVLYKREWWVIFFTLGFFLINYPIIHIVNKDFPIFGYPLFFLYLMIGWLGSIMVVLLYVWLAERQNNAAEEVGNDAAERELEGCPSTGSGRKTAGEA